MSQYETLFEQFAVVGGQRQQASPLVLAAEPAAVFSPEARKGQLYILAEAAHESLREREACQLIVRTIRAQFYGDSSYSVTSALNKAVAKANAVLYGQNFSAAQQKRVFVGVTCVVVKEQSIYVAQVQPAQAYLRAEGKLRALPPSASWGGGADASLTSMKPNALGASLTIEPTFYRATLKPGDALIVVASALAPHLRREVIDYLFKLDSAEAITGELHSLGANHGLTHFHGFLLGVTAVQPQAAAPARTPRGTSLAERFERLSGDVALRLKGSDARGEILRRDLRRDHSQREQRQLDSLPEEPPPPPRPELRVPSLELGDSLQERVEQTREQRRPPIGRLPARERQDSTPSAFLGEGDYVVPQVARPVDLGDGVSRETFTSYARRAHGEMPDTEPSLGERIVEPFTRAAATARIAAANRSQRRKLPPSALLPRRKRDGLSYRKEGPKFPWLLLSSIALTVLLLVVVGNNLVQQNTQQAQQEVLTEARGAINALRSAADEQAANQLLAEAGIALDSVRTSGVLSDSQQLRQEFSSLEREYERVQASVQRISYLSDLTELGSHPQADAGLSFETLVVPPPATSITETLAYESIYALDSNVGIIYQMDKNGGPLRPLLSPNQQLANGVAVGQIKALAWRIDNIVAVGQIDSGYVYYFRNGPEWNNSNLGGSGEWRREIGNLRFVTYFGNLYFWGALPGNVHKYNSGGQSDLYTPWITNFGTSDIADAVDLAIDGKVYLLSPSGRVQIFDQNAFEKELPAPQVEPQLALAKSLVVSGDDPTVGELFILDPTNRRILQLNKQTGELIQQIRTRPSSPISLEAPSAITVDTTGPQPLLYIVDSGRVLRAALPAPPKPFSPAPAPQPTNRASTP
ncbi:MAG: hypothetical protein H7Z42_05820 [Roseiflexaceae bacterium]|nr:hypothetical protein [Roseiflexaceae bacterium]